MSVVVQPAAGTEPVAADSTPLLRRWLAAALVTALLFLLLFSRPMVLLGRDWWNNPEAGHGLLLAPVAFWLAWKSGVRFGARPNLTLGLLLLGGAVLLRYVSGLAAELFTMRMSLLGAMMALVVCAYGLRQLLHWWLPIILLGLSVPLPEIVLSALALPLQFQASQLGTALLEMRNVPVMLTGNVIRIPGHELFVAEACSGLRSLTALLALGVLLGGISLRHPVSRVLILLLAIPVAIIINGVRVFLTAFLVYFVSPELGRGFMHTTEGWLLFLVAFGALGLIAWIASLAERRFLGAPRDEQLATMHEPDTEPAA